MTPSNGIQKYTITTIAYDKKGRVICTAVNDYFKTHTLMAHYAKKAGNPDRIYLHSEMAALIKARSLGKTVHRLEVIRFNKHGKPANAKPCACCQLAIKDFDVKEVVHT